MQAEEIKTFAEVGAPPACDAVTDMGTCEAPGRRLSMAQLANVSVGLLGVQIVWGLQTVNTTRIFQRLGAQVADLPILWIAAPITGLLVQPIIGYLSDHTRSRFGRRRPYLVVGGLCSAASMLVMASATTLSAAIVALWILTASVNVAMQPMRSLIADLLPGGQRSTGFAVQVIFIGIGAVFASALPWMLLNWGGVSGGMAQGVPAVVQVAYRIGALCLLLTIGWTVLSVREVSTHRGAGPETAESRIEPENGAPLPAIGSSVAWFVAGLVMAGTAISQGLRHEIYLIAAICTLFGMMRCAVLALRRAGRRPRNVLEIVEDIMTMPAALNQLAVVQFFTWFALFAMWVYAVPAVAAHNYGTTDPTSAAYEESANWVGVLFATYDGIAVVAVMALPWLVRRRGLAATHAICLLLGAAGLLGMALLQDPAALWIPAIGIGCAWASILSTPYAMVAEVAPPGKVGVYMGIHNIFLVLPQLVAASVLGVVMDRVFHGNPTSMLVLAAGAMAVASVASLAMMRDRTSRSHA